MDNAKSKFLDGWSGKRLLETQSLADYGIWHIFGEDPNCDFGGDHHQPDLGVVEGVLDDVISYAVELDRFWGWGSGGNIKKIEVKKIAPKNDEEANGVI